MSGYQAKRAIAGLKSLLERAKQEEERSHSVPLFAFGVFAEGRPGHELMDHLQPQTISRFCNIPVSHFEWVQGASVSTNHDATHDGPFFVYLRPEQPSDDAAARREIQNGLTALSRFLPQVVEQVQAIPIDLRGRPIPAEVSNWWALLFHLAIHYPQSLLKANRLRWINVTGPAPSVDPERTIHPSYPCETLVDEWIIQFGHMQAPFDDLVPGAIWSNLRDNVFTSTVRAIEVLITWLEETTADRPPTDWPAVRGRFTGLYRQFRELAEWDNSLSRPKKGEPEKPVPFLCYPECQLVKLGNSFRITPAHEWCGFPRGLAFDRLRLSQRQADAEFLIFRRMPAQFRTLSEQAGNALPDEAEDVAVMFSRPIGRSGSTSCGRAELDPDPAARWVRFVFNSLRQNDSTGEEVRFHYEEPRRGVPFPWHDIYGYATLPNGFFAASARAIELANLLPAEVATATPEASPSIAPQSTAAGRPTADILDVTHPQENHPQVPDGGKNSKPMSSDTTGGAVRNEFAELLAAAEGLGVKGKELLVIKRIVHGQGSVTIADLGSACCWPNPDGNWNSMRRRLNKKLGPKCWELFRQDNEAKARKLAQPKRNQAKKSTAPKTDQARGRK